jgi:hypothetical protein
MLYHCIKSLLFTLALSQCVSSVSLENPDWYRLFGDWDDIGLLDKLICSLCKGDLAWPEALLIKRLHCPSPLLACWPWLIRLGRVDTSPKDNQSWPGLSDPKEWAKSITYLFLGV